jgi:hypothetical protein
LLSCAVQELTSCVILAGSVGLHINWD